MYSLRYKTFANKRLGTGRETQSIPGEGGGEIGKVYTQAKTERTIHDNCC